MYEKYEKSVRKFKCPHCGRIYDVIRDLCRTRGNNRHYDSGKCPDCHKHPLDGHTLTQAEIEYFSSGGAITVEKRS